MVLGLMLGCFSSWEGTDLVELHHGRDRDLPTLLGCLGLQVGDQSRDPLLALFALPHEAWRKGGLRSWVSF